MSVVSVSDVASWPLYLTLLQMYSSRKGGFCLGACTFLAAFRLVSRRRDIGWLAWQRGSRSNAEEGEPSNDCRLHGAQRLWYREKILMLIRERDEIVMQ